MSDPTPNKPYDRDAEILKLAKKRLYRDEEFEIDSDAKISEGDDNGCYVQGWSWLSFEGTAFDKDEEG